jgi:hypothetical protein
MINWLVFLMKILCFFYEAETEFQSSMNSMLQTVNITKLHVEGYIGCTEIKIKLTLNPLIKLGNEPSTSNDLPITCSFYHFVLKL